MHEVLNEKITLVSVNISTFSGYRRATREHIASLGGLLPVCAAITEGSIKVFPCDGTKSLQSVRRGVFRKLQAQGIRALGSQNVFAVRTEDLPEIEIEIADAEAEFKSETGILASEYENIFEAHVSSNAAAETIIRSLKVDVTDAVSRCRFTTNVFKIAPFIREGETEDECVEGIVRGLGRQLYEEISADMEKLSKNDAFERQRVGQKTLRPIKAAVVKMRKLAFLDDSVLGAVTMVEDTLKSLPSEGYIQGQPFMTLLRLVDIMSDTDELLNAASKCKNGVAACDVLYPPAIPVFAQAVAQPAAVAVPAVEIVTEAAVAVVEQSVVDPDTVVSPVDVQAIVTDTVVDAAPVIAAPFVSLPPIFVPKAAENLVPLRTPPLPVAAPAIPGLLKPRALLKNNSMMF